MSLNQKRHLAQVRATRIDRQRKQRLNTRNVMNCGIGATIIDYQNADNITIRFDDGAVSCNKRYRSFVIGGIAHPEMKNKRITSINEHIILWYFSRLGFQKASSGSLKKLGFGRMELDCYNPDLKIAIEYDGVHWHSLEKKIKTDEKKNRVCKKNGIHLIRIREPGLPAMDNCENFILDTSALFSQSLEQILNILVHRMNTSINIDFNKDKQLIVNDFSEKNKFNKVGEVSVASNGEVMRIVAYRTNRDLDVEFESGVVIKNKRYDHFKDGFISKEPEKYSDKEAERLGKRERMNCGDYATITKYKNVNDIDVVFDDGTLIEHRTYQNFKNGQIKNPNYKAPTDLQVGITLISK